MLRLTKAKPGEIPMLKERDDGLIQRSWEDYPQTMTGAKSLRAVKWIDKVVERLKIEPSRTSQVAEALNITDAVADYYLYKLKEKGEVKKEGSRYGRWFWVKSPAQKAE